jgi:uncharacterized membrane protein (DUF4010 family)
LKLALVFALLYAIVILAVAAGTDYFGGRGLYVVAGLSGLTDMDAITLSTARLVQIQRLEPDQAWRLILVALMLFVLIAPLYSVGLAAGGILLWAWPPTA